MTDAFIPPTCPRCGVELPTRKINLCAVIADVVRQRPDLTYAKIGELYGVSMRTVKRYARRAGLKRKRAAEPRFLCRIT
jgi:hypothetical protein